MPVDTSPKPVPSRSTRPVIWVSLVLRSTVATRTGCAPRKPPASAGEALCSDFAGPLPHSAIGLTAPPPCPHVAFATRGRRCGLQAARRMADRDGMTWHGTTILCVRKDRQVVIAGDGQVTMGQAIVKSNARKLRRL